MVAITAVDSKKLTAWRSTAGVAPGGFARAHRLSAHGTVYTWIVRAGRYALPAVALVLAGVVIATLMKDPVQDHLSQLPEQERTLPGQSALEGARYEGLDTEGRPFVLTADKALRVLPPNATASDLAPAQGETVDLVRPKAALTMSGDKSLELTASEGRFVQDNSTLDLKGGVTLSDQAGNEIWVDNVNVNLTDNALVSDTPVKGHGPDGTIDAEGLRLEQGGERVIFEGRTTLTLPAKKDKAP